MADNLTPQQRSHCMSRVRRTGTDIESLLARKLREKGLTFSKNVAELPGKPDIVFSQARIAVFVDGDFWHGYRFPIWQHTLSAHWRQKIERNRARDRRNFTKLRRMGWRVIRVWGHSVRLEMERVLHRIDTALIESKPHRPPIPFLRRRLASARQGKQ